MSSHPVDPASRPPIPNRGLPPVPAQRSTTTLPRSSSTVSEANVADGVDKLTEATEKTGSSKTVMGKVGKGARRLFGVGFTPKIKGEGFVKGSGRLLAAIPAATLMYTTKALAFTGGTIAGVLIGAPMGFAMCLSAGDSFDDFSSVDAPSGSESAMKGLQKFVKGSSRVGASMTAWAAAPLVRLASGREDIDMAAVRKKTTVSGYAGGVTGGTTTVVIGLACAGLILSAGGE